MLYAKKIQQHVKKADLNAKKAEESLQKGDNDKGNHYKRISEAHYRNALYYSKHSERVSLAMAF
jgi:hypothetical protein